MFSVGTGQTEPDAEDAVATSSSGKRDGRVRLEELADDEEEHRNQAADETGEVDALRPESAPDRCAEERGDDRRRDLRQEQEPVLRVRQSVLVGVGEDRARGRERDQHDPLYGARRVDDRRLGPCRHAASLADR